MQRINNFLDNPFLALFSTAQKKLSLPEKNLEYNINLIVNNILSCIKQIHSTYQKIDFMPLLSVISDSDYPIQFNIKRGLLLNVATTVPTNYIIDTKFIKKRNMISMNLDGYFRDIIMVLRKKLDIIFPLLCSQSFDTSYSNLLLWTAYTPYEFDYRTDLFLEDKEDSSSSGIPITDMKLLKAFHNLRIILSVIFKKNNYFIYRILSSMKYMKVSTQALIFSFFTILNLTPCLNTDNSINFSQNSLVDYLSNNLYLLNNMVINLNYPSSCELTCQVLLCMLILYKKELALQDKIKKIKKKRKEKKNFFLDSDDITPFDRIIHFIILEIPTVYYLISLISTNKMNSRTIGFRLLRHIIFNSGHCSIILMENDSHFLDFYESNLFQQSDLSLLVLSLKLLYEILVHRKFSKFDKLYESQITQCYLCRFLLSYLQEVKKLKLFISLFMSEVLVVSFHSLYILKLFIIHQKKTDDIKQIIYEYRYELLLHVNLIRRKLTNNPKLIKDVCDIENEILKIKLN